MEQCDWPRHGSNSITNRLMRRRGLVALRLDLANDFLREVGGAPCSPPHTFSTLVVFLSLLFLPLSFPIPWQAVYQAPSSTRRLSLRHLRKCSTGIFTSAPGSLQLREVSMDTTRATCRGFSRSVSSILYLFPHERAAKALGGASRSSYR